MRQTLTEIYEARVAAGTLRPDPAQHALLPVLNQRVKNAVARKQLARVFFHPQPGAHFQRQGQETGLIAVQSCLLKRPRQNWRGLFA